MVPVEVVTVEDIAPADNQIPCSPNVNSCIVVPMKLKLFLSSIFALLSLVAYQKYAEYSALKSINSYESCVAAKGSVIQESYPATCFSRLGARFTQPINQASTASWNAYSDSKYDFSIKFPQEANIVEKDFGTLGQFKKVAITFIGSSQDQNVYVDTDGYSISIAVYDKELSENVLSSLREYSQDKCYPTFVCSEIDTTTISKRIAKTYSLNNNVKNISNYYLENNDYLFHIELQFSRSQIYNQIATQILSTFKFTN